MRVIFPHHTLYVLAEFVSCRWTCSEGFEKALRDVEGCCYSQSVAHAEQPLQVKSARKTLPVYPPSISILLDQTLAFPELNMTFRPAGGHRFG